MNLQEQILRIQSMMGVPQLNEEILTTEKETQEGVINKMINSLSRFIQGSELYDFLDKIKTVSSFGDFTLKYEKSHEGANQFIINITNKENEKVGKFVAFIYKNKETGTQNLQIQKVEIFPKFRGRGIMRTFYQEFNQWLKDNFDNFDKFTSDFIFLYDEKTGNYDGFNMWENLVDKGLAVDWGLAKI